MAIPKDVADKLRGFTNHGARFQSVSGENARGRCPFGCKSTKGRTDPTFTVHVETKAWQCMRCGRKGGWTEFMTEIVDFRARALRGLPLQRLAGNRCVSEPTLRAFGVGWDQGAGLYTVPVRDTSGIVTNIHRYRIDQRPFGTVGGRNSLFIADPAEFAAAETVWVCEGEWDAMALWEALRAVGSPEAVAGVAGATSAGDHVAQAAQGKHALLAFDHEDPGPNPDAAARERLRGRALSVKSVHWPKTNKPGYDVRDLWAEHDRRARSFLRALRGYLKEAPVVPNAPEARQSPKVVARTAEASMVGDGVPRDEVVRVYKKWMHLPDPEVIDVMFGAVLANRLEGDPLWLFIVGPPGCGKSMLLMSLVDAPLCTSRTTVTRAALVSGRSTGRDDPSLLPKLDGRVLVIKDFTTTLKRPEADREEIFGVLRDAYDGRYVHEFHGLLREYVTQFGMVVGVTAEIEKLGSSHTLAGERFVKYYMHRRHGRVRVGHQAAKRALHNRPRQAQMREELEAAAKAALTRAAPKEPTLPEREEDRILGMAAWTAALRGAVARDRYTRELVFKPVAEIGTRLSTQLSKLAAGIAAFRGKDEITSAETAVIARVARDSAPDIREEIVRQMYTRSRDDRAPSAEIAKWTRLPWEAVSSHLRDMNMLGVVQAEGEAYALSRSLVRLMQGLDLYAEETAWRRR